jgi:hypothetical protein
MAGPFDDLDEDERDEDSRPRRRRRRPDPEPEGPPAERVAVAVGLVGLVVWCVLFCAIALGGLAFVAALGEARSAPQEAAAGAVFSTGFIGLYVLARCVEKGLAAVVQLRAK